MASFATAAPVRRGSSGSGAAGGRPLFTEQNPHERVQTSPRIMNVAVRRPQHSAMLGQSASSQIVWSRSARATRKVSWYPAPVGYLTLSQGGFLVTVASLI